MLTGRQDDAFLGWLKALPDELVRTRPVLCVYDALALVSFDPEAAEGRLRDAERLVDMAAQVSERPAGAAVEMVVHDDEGFGRCRTRSRLSVPIVPARSATCPASSTTPGRRGSSYPRMITCGVALRVGSWGLRTGPAATWRRPTGLSPTRGPVCG